MSTDPRLFSLIDEFDDFPYDSALRIPPLQDPLPFTPSSRPSPLEPNARVSDGPHNATAKLTSRRKALAEAKLIGDTEVSTSCGLGASDHNSSLGRDIDEQRKRQKFDTVARSNDFVQLPKPIAKAQEPNLPPFKPVPVLNGLHEPPPSAALFPPITSNAPQESEASLTGIKNLSPVVLSNLKKERKPHDLKVDLYQDNSGKEQSGLVKRVALRPRRKWTEAETQYLLEGVAIFGAGKWKKILSHPELRFSAERTTVDLKDRYRTCRTNQEKNFIRNQPPQEQHLAARTSIDIKVMAAEHHKNDVVSTKLLSRGVHLATSAVPADDSISRDNQSLADSQDNPGFITVNTLESGLSPIRNRQLWEMELKDQKTRLPQPYQPPPRTLPPRWTKEEDASLVMGYQKHGFKWTAITRDPEMNLGHRIGSQVRDRFRLKFSDLYEASPPSPEFRNNKKRKASRCLKIRTSINDENVRKGSGISPGKGREIIPNKYCALEYRKESPTTISPPQSTIGSYVEVGMGLERILESRQHERIFMFGSRRELRKRASAEQRQEMVSSCDEQSRQSSTAADEARNLGIIGMLNDEGEEGGRLPSIKHSHDDWGVDSVTLPPLLWEDMAARPIFDLD